MYNNIVYIICEFIHNIYHTYDNPIFCYMTFISYKLVIIFTSSIYLLFKTPVRLPCLLTSMGNFILLLHLVLRF